MEAIEFTSSKIVGRPDAAGMPQVYELSGGLYVVLVDKLSEGKKEGKYGDKITHMKEVFLKNTSEGSISSLKRAVLESGLSECQIGVLVVSSGVAYALVNNGVSLRILRDGRLANIVTASEGQSHSASGHVKSGDVLILGTKEFFEFEIPEGVGSVIEKSGMEALLPSIQMADNTQSVSVIAISINSEEAAWTNNGKGLRFGSLRIFLAGVIDRIVSLLPRNEIRVSDEYGARAKKNRTAIVAGILLLVILILSVIFGMAQKSAKDKKAAYEDRLTEAKHQFEESKALSGVDGGRARELILAARRTVESIKSEGVSDPEVDQLLVDLSKNIGQVAGIYTGEPQLFLDLGLVASQFKADEMVISEGVIRVLDKSGKKMVKIATDTKRTELVSGFDLVPSPIHEAAYADKNYVLSYDGIRQVGADTALFIKPDWDINNIKIISFAGNMYVMDTSGGVIWRYAGIPSGFAEKANWFAPGIAPDLSSISSWAIDGSIWTISKSGRILKYSMGAPVQFNVSGLDKNIGSDPQIFTDDTSDYLYVLDKGNSRIIVFDKSGHYKAEYGDAIFSNSVNFVVSEKDRKIIVLSDSKLYQISADHL